MDRPSKKSRESSKVEKTKKCETSEQRAKRYSRFIPFVFVGGIVATTSMINTMYVGATMPSDSIQPSSNNLQEGYTPSAKSIEQTKKYFDEIENPSTPFLLGPKKDQGTSSQETSETHQREQDKGRDPLSSHEEMIERWRSVMGKLNEKQVRKRSLLEVPDARTLLSDCQDLCSETPASVDCIKQCTPPVAPNPSTCLDVSLSEVHAKLEPIPGHQPPDQEILLNYTLSARNNCPQAIKDVKYQVQGLGECMKTLQSFWANPSSLASGDVAGVKAGQYPSMTASCWGSPPSFLSSYISASGIDTTTNAAVSSPYKTFIVQGDRPYVMSECHQTCPPATDTPPPPAIDTPNPPPVTDNPPPPAMDTPSIVFVHGIQLSAQKGKNRGHDCNKYWGDPIKFLRKRGLRDLRTIKFYSDDKNCQNGNDEGIYSSDLHDPLYKSLCPDYHAGKEGTNDESIYRLSCLFAQYLHHNFGLQDRKVVLVGHSLGGMIIRTTMYQMQEYAGQDDFPPTIGHVTKAITFNSPHNGVNYAYANTGCGGCAQGLELWTGSDLIGALTTSGRNPQTSEGFTEWTTIGSQCDLVVIPTQSSVGMDASHAIVYSGVSKVNPTCYDHGGALHDFNTDHDAEYYCCDTSNTDASPCGPEYRPEKNPNWRKKATGLHGLDLLYTEVTKGFTCSARRIRPRLWMAATLASAWALLAR